MKPIVILEAGHRRNTPGKCSPDGSFREWGWNEKCKNETISLLRSRGYTVLDATPEGDDDSLSARVAFVNARCREHGTGNVIYISIHCNAAGNGGWMQARRWSVWTSRGQTSSDSLAERMYEAAVRKWGQSAVRSDTSDGDHDYEEDFYVLRRSLCTAVLVENFFYDNREDLQYLLSPDSIRECAEVIASGLDGYVRTLGEG